MSILSGHNETGWRPYICVWVDLDTFVLFSGFFLPLDSWDISCNTEFYIIMSSMYLNFRCFRCLAVAKNSLLSRENNLNSESFDEQKWTYICHNHMHRSSHCIPLPPLSFFKSVYRHPTAIFSVFYSLRWCCVGGPEPEFVNVKEPGNRFQRIDYYSLCMSGGPVR
jgi:hypothetical protein